MSAYKMRCRMHPPVPSSGEPVQGVYASALLLAETLVGYRLTGTENDPADADTSNRAYDRPLEATR